MNLIGRQTLRTACVGIAAMLTACSGPTSDSRVADEAAIREADAASLRAIAAKQVDATVSFYDEQASILMPNAPIVTGREGIRKVWEQMFAMPGLNFAPKTTKLEVARSGDLAYTQGTYEFTAADPQGRPVNDRGKFVVVWKKQTDGAWKAVADIWNSDALPAAAANQ
jgi:ketosteroid isomerase-like protein